MESKLIVVIMGPGKKPFAEMCLDSFQEADKILYWTSDLDRLQESVCIKWFGGRLEAFDNGWDETDPATNGKCRQRYLEFLKENYPDDWALILDEDEILEEGGIEIIKQFIKEREPGLYNVKMRHLIDGLGTEDATVSVHMVPRRLFTISEAIKYPEHSHPVLEGELKGGCLDVCIWHLGNCAIDYLDYVYKRYLQHCNDSLIHPKEFLDWWKDAHILNFYPRKRVEPYELPKILLKRYNISPDKYYFQNRGLEIKHFIDAIHWKDFFKCKKAVEFGCGLGPRVYALNNIGVETYGFEISKFAVDNKLHPFVYEGNIINNPVQEQELAIAYDVLEHIDYRGLDSAINTLINSTTKYILISVPVNGDPNLLNDSTHKIFEDKEWWIKQFTDKGLKLIPTPEHFLYKEQVMIFEK